MVLSEPQPVDPTTDPSPDAGYTLGLPAAAESLVVLSATALRAWFDAPGRRRPAIFTKRAIDILAAASGLVVLSPVLLVLTIVLAVTTRGHPIFVQERIGRYGQPFRLFKFRTMSLEADRLLRAALEHSAFAAEWRRAHKLRSDPRVTRIGRFLRKHSLDELPQLLNVILGHMSLVGPRPIVQDEMPRFGACIWTVLGMRPGLTSLWSVSGRNDLSYEQRVDLEHRYAENWTLRLDVRILAQTIPAIVRATGAY